MITFRQANLQDIKQIQSIENEFYEGYVCPKEILKSWIEQLSENFIVVEENGKIQGFIFFEYFGEIKAVPFVHKLKHTKSGKFAYVSDVGVLRKDKNLLQKLLEKLIEKAKKDGCKKVIWLTGRPEDRWHRLETGLLLKNNFAKIRKIKKWEAYPNHFVDDHWIWIKEI